MVPRSLRRISFWREKKSRRWTAVLLTSVNEGHVQKSLKHASWGRRDGFLRARGQKHVGRIGDGGEQVRLSGPLLY